MRRKQILKDCVCSEKKDPIELNNEPLEKVELPEDADEDKIEDFKSTLNDSNRERWLEYKKNFPEDNSNIVMEMAASAKKKYNELGAEGVMDQMKKSSIKQKSKTKAKKTVDPTPIPVVKEPVKKTTPKPEDGVFVENYEKGGDETPDAPTESDDDSDSDICFGEDWTLRMEKEIEALQRTEQAFEQAEKDVESELE
jgi:hypothetical protein